MARSMTGDWGGFGAAATGGRVQEAAKWAEN